MRRLKLQISFLILLLVFLCIKMTRGQYSELIKILLQIAGNSRQKIKMN